MTFFTGAVVLAVAAVVAGDSIPLTKSDDPVVCKKERSFSTGSHLRRPITCMRKSEWTMEEKHAQRKLQAVREKGVRPQPPMPTAGSPK